MIARWLTRFIRPRCLTCGAPEVIGLCDACADRLPSVGKHCPTCANGVADERYPCGACLQRPPAYQRLLVRWQFTEDVRDIILRGKYQADRRALRVLEDETCRLLRAHPVAVDAVVAMPVSVKRLRQRGYNQTLYPARAAARLRPYLGEHCRLLQNGNNLAVLPAWLDKAHAVAHLQQHYRAQYGAILSIGMGDSTSDLPFMRHCDYLLTPAESQITQCWDDATAP